MTRKLLRCGAMPAAAKWTTHEIVQEAIAFVDIHGVDALTLRSLGATLGMTHTAIYRYYPNKTALLSEMIDFLFGEPLASAQMKDAPVHERLIATATHLRRVMHQHPNMIIALVYSGGDMPKASELTSITVDMLRELGLKGSQLAKWHRILESYVMGSAVYDFATAPHHLATRKARLTALGTEFSKALTSEKKVDALNEESFRAGLTVLVSQAASEARTGQ